MATSIKYEKERDNDFRRTRVKVVFLEFSNLKIELLEPLIMRAQFQSF